MLPKSTYPFVVASHQLIHIIDADLHACEVLGVALRVDGYDVGFSVLWDEARARLARRVPHAVILNPSTCNGADSIRILRAAYRGTPVIAIQDTVNLDEAVECIKLGAADVQAKPIDSERLIRSLKAAISAPVAVTYGDSKVTISGFTNLTYRENQVLQGITDGRSNKESGLTLGISSRTVEVHRARIMKKLGARNTADLLRIVMAH